MASRIDLLAYPIFRTRRNEIKISCLPVDIITVLCGNSRKLVRNAKSVTDVTFDLKKGIRLAAREAKPLVPRGLHRSRWKEGVEQSYLEG